MARLINNLHFDNIIFQRTNEIYQNEHCNKTISALHLHKLLEICYAYFFI